MSVVILLVGASLLVAGGFLAAYLWAVKSGQYDDKYTPSVRILFDERKTENRSEVIEDGNKKKENKES